MRTGVVTLGWRGSWSARVKASNQPQTRAALWSDGVAVPETAPDLTTADDRSLVAAFLAGRREAFDVIVLRHRRQVYQVCFRFVNNHEDASDLTQDVFVRAFKGLRNFKGDSALATWLYRVGVNVCLNRVALKRAAVEPLDVVPRIDDRTPNPLEEVLRGERANAVRAAIEHLPPKQRATLMLRVYQELSHQEIAEILGSTVGAVKANFFHALGNLKRILESS
jgi:RNA polymerase sigma-70 factor (ECF subfamily)